MDKKFRYSEIFGKTIQGEGHYTGVPTVWFRSWGCNFNCNGFGQKNPEDESTWDLDYLKIDPTKYNKMEDLPVFNTGCDSSYSWAKMFSNLAHIDTAENIAKKIESYMISEHNPEGKFLHPKSKQWTHMAFTGGEPMMAQTAITEIMKVFIEKNNIPKYITIETNGTQKPRENFIDLIRKYKSLLDFDTELFWSISPKLYLSGERWNDAIKPDVVKEYYALSKSGQLKYVVDGSEKAWRQVEEATELYRKEGIDFPVWIMPVGANKEGQEKIQAKVAEEAIERGYFVSARVHVFLFGNVIGK